MANRPKPRPDAEIDDELRALRERGDEATARSKQIIEETQRQLDAMRPKVPKDA